MRPAWLDQLPPSMRLALERAEASIPALERRKAAKERAERVALLGASVVPGQK